ncbi:MAG: (2Fe-2S)-binding protein [Burkholderiales bacterium]
MQRREFVQFCVAAAASASAPALAADAEPRRYSRSRLVDANGAPLHAADVPVNRNLIFHYPYAATPCFLLNLGHAARPTELKTASDHPYTWQGGVGRANSLVAFSAICAHKLTYPTPEISFISYRAEQTPANRRAAVIHCCSEHSQYDPAAGARVVAGPAPQPLAAILLEHDANTDELYALGTLGGELFNEFFDKYAFRLELELGSAARAAVDGRCVVRPLEDFCRQQVKC